MEPYMNLKTKFITLALIALTSTTGILFMKQETEPPKPKTVWDRTAQEVRDLINNRIMEVKAETPEVHEVKNVRIPWKNTGVPVRIYTPSNLKFYTAGKKNPLIMMIHGGAWVAGSLDTHDNMARYLCKNAQAVIVSVGYTNAPEAKYPTQLEQCYAALEWAVDHANELHADPTQLAVVGDSAGGNIAAALCMMARDKKGPTLKLQVLINPATDLTGKGTLERRDDSHDVMRWQALQYVAKPQDVYDPLVSPVLAKDLEDLPPALIILAEKDDLHEDGQKYADRLLAAGNQTRVYTQMGIGHLAGNGARASQSAQESLNIAVEALKKALK
jgi:acetyl esterase